MEGATAEAAEGFTTAGVVQAALQDSRRRSFKTNKFLYLLFQHINYDIHFHHDWVRPTNKANGTGQMVAVERVRRALEADKEGIQESGCNKLPEPKVRLRPRPTTRPCMAPCT